MRNVNCRFYTCILIVLFLSGCKKFIEVDTPNTELVSQPVFDNPEAATAALTSIYSQMFGESWAMSQRCGLLSDELTGSLSTNSEVLQFFKNELQANNDLTIGNWIQAYNYIYQANAVLEGLQNFYASNILINNQLTGEAKFIRAFWYFYLVNCYGDIPLAVNTDYRRNAQLTRSPKQLIYEQILADLLDAKSLLNSNFVANNDTSYTNERVRPTKWAAGAMLARVYLYLNKMDSAEIEATEVISNNIFSLEPDVNNVFLANSTEAIWQLSNPLPSSFGGQTLDGHYFSLVAGINVNTATNNVQINPQLMSTFENGDVRKAAWIGSYVDNNSNSYYFPYKYQVYMDDPTFNPNGRLEYTMMLRLAEQVLIRAEARVQVGNITGALDDLNAIRTRAGLSLYTGLMDKESLLSAIIHERQVELFAEWGHRWFDLNRTGKVNSVMGPPGNVCAQKGGVWNSYKSLFPIPQSDLNTNAHLTQNPGYN